jgi:hypothetical protein
MLFFRVSSGARRRTAWRIAAEDMDREIWNGASDKNHFAAAKFDDL